MPVHTHSPPMHARTRWRAPTNISIQLTSFTWQMRGLELLLPLLPLITFSRASERASGRARDVPKTNTLDYKLLSIYHNFPLMLHNIFITYLLPLPLHISHRSALRTMYVHLCVVRVTHQLCYNRRYNIIIINFIHFCCVRCDAV